MSILPTAPSKYVYNDPEFYTKVIPPEYIGNRRAELMYGEMRLARFMLVFRKHMEYWLAGGRMDHSTISKEFAKDCEFLAVWACIDDRRKTAWPTMVTLADRYIEEIFGRGVYERKFPWLTSTGVSWIDSHDTWQTKIVEPYDRLVAGTNYKDL